MLQTSGPMISPSALCASLCGQYPMWKNTDILGVSMNTWGLPQEWTDCGLWASLRLFLMLDKYKGITIKLINFSTTQMFFKKACAF